MSINYSELDWPTLPANITEQLLAHCRIAENIRDPNRRHHNDYHHYRVPVNVEEWCRTNLPITEHHTIVVQRFFSMGNIFNIPRHTDGTRTENFNYVISGTGPITRWFKEDNTIIESVKFDSEKWYHLKVNVPHDVINIKDERIALSIFIPF